MKKLTRKEFCDMLKYPVALQRVYLERLKGKIDYDQKITLTMTDMTEILNEFDLLYDKTNRAQSSLNDLLVWGGRVENVVADEFNG